jgi:putative SOS response-associated peptidase YedK
MCGRFAQAKEILTLLNRFNFYGEDAAGVVPRYNIAPTQSVPVIFHDGEDLHLRHMRWGLIPHWAKDPAIGNRLINARGETAAEKPSFRTPFKRRRCLVPATGFYEWQKPVGGKGSKIPYYIFRRDEGLLCFAGLWDHWDAPNGDIVQSFTIITTRPNKLMRPVHDRMPVILDEADENLWLNPDIHAPDRMQPLVRPCPDSLLAMYPVSTLVNSPTHESRDCIEPLPEQEELL